MTQLVEQIRERVRSVRDGLAIRRAHRSIERAKLDSRIVYPCYKSFDDFLDIERLRSLDGYVTERVQKRVRTRNDEKFYTGNLTVTTTAVRRPGSRIIYLTRAPRAVDYFSLEQADLWGPTEDAVEFSTLMEFIRTLPFKRTSRIMITYDATGNPVTAHRDHSRTGTCHDFVWFRTNLASPLYMLDRRRGRTRYVESYSAWFDTCNQFHGVDANPGLSMSIRVDGTFTDELRRRIPIPRFNAASTPALWACIGDHNH